MVCPLVRPNRACITMYGMFNLAEQGSEAWDWLMLTAMNGTNAKLIDVVQLRDKKNHEKRESINQSKMVIKSSSYDSHIHIRMILVMGDGIMESYVYYRY